MAIVHRVLQVTSRCRESGDYHLNGSSSRGGGSSATLGSSSSDRDWWVWWPGGDALVQHDRPADDVVSHVQVEVLLAVAHGEQQLGQVVGVEGGCLEY